MLEAAILVEPDIGGRVAEVAAAFLAITTLPFLLYRAITEDRILQAELPGYRDYAQRVRWRLIPGLW